MTDQAEEAPDSGSATESERSGSLAGHIVRRGVPIVVLLLVLVGAYMFWRLTDPAPTHQAAPFPQEAVRVRVVTIEPETVEMPLRFLGQTEASQVVEIRARVAGYLGPLEFQEGTRVEQGAPLFQIDRIPYEVELARANARLASARATLARANHQVSRYESLLSQQAANLDELEDWQTQAAVAAANEQQALAEVAAATLELGYTTIEAPITGMIGRALKDPGSYVDAGAGGLLAVVQQVDPISVRYSITEQEMLRFQRQVDAGRIEVPEISMLRLELTLADGSIYPHLGTIRYVDVQVDATTGTSVVRGEAPNAEGMLRPGQFVYAAVKGVRLTGVIRVPQRAVQQSPAGASVLVVGADGLAESRPVELGPWLGSEHWIIERGLSPGDRVIIDRLMMVRPGMAVEVAPEDEAPAEAAAPAGASR